MGDHGTQGEERQASSCPRAEKPRLKYDRPSGPSHSCLPVHLSTCCAMLVTAAPAHWHTGRGIVRNQNKSDENNTSCSPRETVCPPCWRNFQPAGEINTSKRVTEDSDIRGGKTWVPVRENPRFSGEAPSHNHKIAAPSPAARKKGLHACV